jgi:hypothetical protein
MEREFYLLKSSREVEFLDPLHCLGDGNLIVWIVEDVAGDLQVLISA